MFLQGISGTLELFHLSLVRFQQLVEETTGHPVAVYQRVDQAGQNAADRRAHSRRHGHVDGVRTGSPGDRAGGQPRAEIEALREFLTPRGHLPDSRPAPRRRRVERPEVRAMEYAHHGDPLVPRQQRFGQYTRSLMKGLGVPVENQYGLAPATVMGTSSYSRWSPARDLDSRGWLTGVSTFNFHPHLPHYAITTSDANSHSRAGAGSRSTCRARIRSPRPVTGSSTCSCGCPRATHAPATSCWRIRRSSRRFSGLRKPRALLEEHRDQVMRQLSRGPDC